MKNDKVNLWHQMIAPSLSLFTSLGTLVCCALPALFVSLGMGAALVGLISSAPWLVALSEHKVIIFVASGIMLVFAICLQWKGKSMPCPSDPTKAKACARLRQISWAILIGAIIIYCVGFFFAFVAVHVFY